MPIRVEVAVVPSNVLLHHRRRRRMTGNIIYGAFANHQILRPSRRLSRYSAPVRIPLHSYESSSPIIAGDPI